LIITDHHRPLGKIPAAAAVVDPKQQDCGYSDKDLAGVGVAFKLVSLIYDRRKLSLPGKVYELLMLGTVADMVPLLGENRFWVQHGLQVVSKKQSIAFSVLADNSKLMKKRFSSTDIGFMIAPQINALGRLDDSRDAVRFLISSSEKEVALVGEKLRLFNEKRKEVEKEIFDEIETRIKTGGIDVEKENVLVASSRVWPSGVIGLVAGKIMKQYCRPTFVFHEQDDGLLKGSCRSIPAFNLFDAMNENKDLLVHFGGHSCAAGLSIKKNNLSEFKKRLEEKISSELALEDLQPKINVDACCSLNDMNKKMVCDLERLEPFGTGNEQPLFMVKDIVLLKKPRLLKDRHVKCSIFSDGTIKPVIFFNRPELCNFFDKIGDSTFHLVGSVMKNEWKGRVQIEMQGLDVSSSSI
jgi:single-stranded-DNA-specific exonuclease